MSSARRPNAPSDIVSPSVRLSAASPDAASATPSAAAIRALASGAATALNATTRGQDRRVRRRVRQSERAAKHVTDLVVKPHGGQLERHARRVGAAQGECPGLEVVGSRDDIGQRAGERPHGIFGRGHGDRDQPRGAYIASTACAMAFIPLAALTSGGQ